MDTDNLDPPAGATPHTTNPPDPLPQSALASSHNFLKTETACLYDDGSPGVEFVSHNVRQVDGEGTDGLPEDEQWTYFIGDSSL